MKRTFNRLSFVPAFALSLGLCAFAMPAMAGQNQTPSQTPPPTQSQRTQTRHQTKSVTGCLEQGADGNYTITSKDGMRYNLEPMQGVKLASHVNHQVTVRGTVSPKSGMTGEPGESTQQENRESPQTQRREQRSTNAETLHVRSVKTISNTCQGQ